MISLLQVEFGYGSETYDFTEIFVKRKNNKIIKKYNCFIGFFIGLFHMYNDIIYYGYGYKYKDLLYQDLKNKEISLINVNEYTGENLSDISNREINIINYVIGTIKIIFFTTEYELSVVQYNDEYYACDNPIRLIDYLQQKLGDYKGILKVLNINDLKNIKYNTRNQGNILVTANKDKLEQCRLTKIEKEQLKNIFTENYNQTYEQNHNTTQINIIPSQEVIEEVKKRNIY